MLERAERQVKQSPLKAMLGLNRVIEPDKEERVEKTETKETTTYKMGAVGSKEEPKKKRNERSYKRYRGKSDGVATKPMSYYISDLQIEAILLRTTREGGEKDKSAVVRAALDAYLVEEFQFLSKAKKEGAK
jgi:hypothetical protein|nr:hypothetical protein [uncultured Lachnoclostridium sp.]